MPRRRRVKSNDKIAMVAAVVALLVAACSEAGAAPEQPPSPIAAATVAFESPRPPVAATEVPTWDDGLDHVVVFADRPGSGVSTDELPATADATPVSGPTAGLPAFTGPMTLVHLDGSTEPVQVPDQSLTAVAPETSSERSALEAALLDGSGVALLVEDGGGAVGPPATRYVLHGDLLIEIDGVDVAPGRAIASGNTVASMDTLAPDGNSSVGAADELFLQQLRDIPGVISVELVSPGVAAVAMSGSRDAIASLPGIAQISDDTLLGVSDDPLQGQQWFITNTGSGSQAGGWPGVAGVDMGATTAWSVTDGTGIVVADIDTGVDIDHPDLAPHIWSNPNEVCGNGVDDDHDGLVDDCKGWDFGSNDANPRPDASYSSSSHGTHVAGIIGAIRNGVGVVGIAPGATIMPLKVAAVNGSMTSSALYAALVFASDHGARVINLSLGTPPGTPRSGVSAMEAGIVYARQHGVTVVAAAGNNGIDTSTQLVFPAAFAAYYDNVISVGATTNSDTRASFSNYGATTNVWAPGFWMYSTVPGGYGWMSGTSMATPAVVGAVAAVLASGQATTPAAVRQRLIDTAVTTSAGPRVDVAAAIGARQASAVQVSVAGADALVPDTTGRLSYNVAATGLAAQGTQLRVTIGAASGSAVYAVGDLPVDLSDAAGTFQSSVTADDGSLTPFAVRDAAALAASGWNFASDLKLPTGDYALVFELLSASGQTLGGTQVAYISVGDTTPPTTPVPTTTVAGPGTDQTTLPPRSPVTTAPPSPVPSPGTTAPGTTVPGTTAPGTTVPVIPGQPTPTTIPGTSTSTPPTTPGTVTFPTPPPSTSAPGSGGGTGAPVTTAPVTTAPGTTAPGTGQPPTATTSTTNPTPTNPTPPTTTTPGTTPVPSTAPPATLVQPPAATTTTPVPPGASDETWRVDAMTPRQAGTSGGTWLSITGQFPTSVPVYVWFGDKGIVQAVSTGSSLLLQSPSVASAGSTDVTIKFSTTRAFSLTLTNAFTFVAPINGGTQPPSTQPPSTQPPTGSQPPSTQPPAPGSTLPVVHQATLRPRPAAGPLSTVQLASWPRPGCKSATCGSTRMP